MVSHGPGPVCRLAAYTRPLHMLRLAALSGPCLSRICLTSNGGSSPNLSALSHLWGGVGVWRPGRGKQQLQPTNAATGAGAAAGCACGAPFEPGHSGAGPELRGQVEGAQGALLVSELHCAPAGRACMAVSGAAAATSPAWRELGPCCLTVSNARRAIEPRARWVSAASERTPHNRSPRHRRARPETAVAPAP